MKTVRFSSVVEVGGRPHMHLAWCAPAVDAGLQAAVKQHRVLTVHQHLRGAKKDFGVVGLEPASDAQFLIFPKSLRKFAGQHVVGIQYELLADASSGSATAPGRKRETSHASPTKTTHVVRFPSAHVRPRPASPDRSKSTAVVAPPRMPSPPPPVETDPVKIEIRRALADLAAQRTARVRRRLLALLD